MHMNKEELTQSVKQKRQSTALLALYIKQVIFLLQKKPASKSKEYQFKCLQIQNTVSRLTKVTEELKTLHMEIKEKVKTVKVRKVLKVLEANLFTIRISVFRL